MNTPRALLFLRFALLSTTLVALPSDGGAREADRGSAQGARFQGWTPLSDYVTAGLAEGGTFRLTLPSRRGLEEWTLRPVDTHAAGYGAEVSARGGERTGRARPRVRTFAGRRVGSEDTPPRRGSDFVRLAREPGGRLSGLARVDGVLYDLTAEGGDLVLSLREVEPDEVAGVLSACGTVAPAEAPSALEPEDGGTAAAAGPLLEIELGTEADAPFVAQLGDVEAANARILSIVNAINGIYEADLGLTNRVVFQRAWEGTDPYSSSDSGVLLGEFRSEFLAGVATPTDDAQLFSGRDFEGSTVGRAYVSAACGSFRFGVNQYYGQSDSLTRLIVAHEMGHNLGGSHTTDGIMAPSIDSSVTWFSATSQSEIGAFVDAVSCLTEPAGGDFPPTLEPIGPQNVRENDTLAFQLVADDPDGGSLAYAATPLPPGASLSSGGFFSWRPPLETIGCGGFVDQEITFSVTDPDGNRASETVVISVIDAPSGSAPAFAQVADRAVTAGQPLSIPLSAPDADGDTVSFGSGPLPAGASLSPGGVLAWTPNGSQIGEHQLDVTATDCTGRSTGQRFTVDVTTEAPFLESLSSTTGRKGDWLTITGGNFAGKKVKVFFGPKKRKAKEVTATSLVVKVPKKKKKIVGNEVPVTIWRDGVVSVNEIVFTYAAD